MEDKDCGIRIRILGKENQFRHGAVLTYKDEVRGQ